MDTTHDLSTEYVLSRLSTNTCCIARSQGDTGTGKRLLVRHSKSLWYMYWYILKHSSNLMIQVKYDVR